MVNAVILLNVEREMVNDVAQSLAGMRGISEVYSVSGRFDLVAIIRVKDNDHLVNIVTNHLRKISGILSTETMLAFQAFSQHDLDSIFSIGLD